MDNRIVIYGAGFAGKVLATYFTVCQNMKVHALVVSKGHRELEHYTTTRLFAEKYDIPVLELDNLVIDNSLIVYNTVLAGHTEVVESLLKRGVSGKQIREVEIPYSEVFHELFHTLGISLETDVIHFGDIDIFNFLKEDSAYTNTFLGTLGDELLPGLYQDTSFSIDGPYENDVVQLEKEDVIIDAGANLGLFSCYAASKGCKVYACDPDSRCVKVLEKQRELYPMNIAVLPVGLSDSCGTSTYYESDACALSSMTMPQGRTTEKTIQLETIDHLMESGQIERVDYIKADIEGAERNMLRGATNTLKKYAPKLSICTYHYKEDPKLLEEIIKAANPDYVVVHQWRKLYAYVPNA